MTAAALKIGLVGFGNIGTGVIKALQKNGDTIAKRIGRPLELAGIADLDITTNRGVEVDASLLTTNVDDLINNSEIEVIIELTGVVSFARELCSKALKSGKHVVTANKALLSEHLAELTEIAKDNNVSLLYEAAVGGAIPCIRSLQQSLSANQFSTIAGILNGTCNYILAQMITEGASFQEALDKAQKNGFAEPDPTLDIEGIDTAHKIAVLASLAFGQNVQASDVHTEGLTKIEAIDIAFAATNNFAIKLLGIARHDADSDSLEIRVHPTFLSLNSALSTVRGVFNAVLIEGNLSGSSLMVGRGAGPLPTASAILNDIMAVASGGAAGDAVLSIDPSRKNIKPMDQIVTSYYLRLVTTDGVGAGSLVAGELGKQNIKIAEHSQAIRDDSELHDVFVLTENTTEKAMQTAVTALKSIPQFTGEPLLVRVEKELTGTR